MLLEVFRITYVSENIKFGVCGPVDGSVEIQSDVYIRDYEILIFGYFMSSWYYDIIIEL